MIPNFVIIGAPRAGTTSLYHYLRQHPQIVMSRIKETDYFRFLASQCETEYTIEPRSNWIARSLPEYQALFDMKTNTKAVGEASPLYLYTPGVPQQISSHLPKAKLILVLRNPVERAYSAYLKNRREGTESRSFEDAIEQEIHNPSKIVCSETFYVRAGLYFEHITRYLQYFDRSQLRIVFQRDLQETPTLFMKDLFEFLNVDSDFSSDVSVRFNEALPPLMVKSVSARRVMKSFTRSVREYLPQKLYYALLNLKYAINKKVAVYPLLSRQTRLKLRDEYIQDTQHLQKLLGRDLSMWLEVA
jgi:hypothetical protein